MRAASILVALVILASVGTADTLTWVPWEVSAGGNHHEYARSQLSAGWATHQANAESHGAYLATLKTADENTFVKENVLHLTSTHWFGLYQPEGYVGDDINLGWEWVDGDPLDYDSSEGVWLDWVNWAEGQPDGYTQIDNGGYARIYGGTGEWSDWQGGANYWAVYERAIPEPATLLMVLCGVAAVGLKRRLER